jgi:hypothetical protein
MEAEAMAREALLVAAVSSAPRSTRAEARVLEACAAYVPPEGAEAPELVSAECSEQICRLELRHLDPDSVSAMIARLASEPALRGSAFMRRREAGPGYVTTYFVAQGDFRLPRPTDHDGL